jgi:predicted permease
MRRWPDRVISVLLRLFPKEFRADYGIELTTVFRDQYRTTRGWSRCRLWIDTFADFSLGAFQEHWSMTLNDLRISFRRQRSHPGFTAVAIASLALGIGANTAIFSVIHTSLLAPLPFRDPDKLVMLWSRPDNRDARSPVASADLVDWRERSASFEHLEMLTGPNRVTVGTGGNYPERIGEQNVTPGFFPMLGVQPVLGRFFTEEETQVRDPRVVLIGESFWRNRFGGDPNVLGKELTVSGFPRSIIGIVPSTYSGGYLTHNVDVWLPIDLSPTSDWVQRKIRWMLAIGKLKNGVSLESAQAELKGIAAQLAVAYPDSNKNWTVFVQPLREALGGGFRNLLAPLAAAVGFVLLIACANVANLLLARAASRRRELAVRSALGAARERLIRELLADGFALAIPGALLGLLVAWAGIHIFLALMSGFPYAVGFNLPVLAFTCGVGILTALIAGLLPAWQASKANITEGLKEGGKGSAGGQRTLVRNVIVVAEMALAVVLLVGAGLMLNTVVRLQGVPLGFDAQGIVTMRLDMAGDRYARLAPRRDIDMRYVEPPVNHFYEQLVSEVASQPWVQELALAAALPMAPSGAAGAVFQIPGSPPSEKPMTAQLNCITQGYFLLLRIPVVRGRVIAEQDRAGSPWVAVINEAFARRYFAREDPIGKFITIKTTEQEQPRQIVGVVADHRRNGQRIEPLPEIYMSFAQQPRLIPGNYQGLRLRPTLAVRTSMPLHTVEEAVRKAAGRLDPQIPIHDVKPLTTYIEDRSGLERFYLRLLGLFAGLAVALAAIGVFGLMHH